MFQQEADKPNKQITGRESQVYQCADFRRATANGIY
jgi:hypothetical protein